MSNATQTTPQAPPVETITVKVDGRVVVVPKTTPDPITGKPVPTTMIQACNVGKVDVPHYCYHPKLPIAGNCRMCLVEYGMPALGPDRKPLTNPDGSVRINKAPRPAIACATPISPGMEIYTNTPSVKQMRESVLEFLLINHPLDCPICDQAGECKLQEYSMDHGQTNSRFVEEKVHKPKHVDLGPRIMLDDERCILCTRCIRFTRDIAGDDALGIINRGGINTLSAYPGKPFDNNYSLNTVDLCPVGALTSKDFRFNMRVWFLKETKSLCASCGTGCNIVTGSREGRLYRLEPRQNDAVNVCWMCDYGRLNYKWVHRPDRLREVRGLEGRATTWTAALRDIAGRLKGRPADSCAMLVSARLSTEELWLLGKLARQIGATIDAVPRQGLGDHLLLNPDRNPNTVGARILGVAADPMGSAIPRIAEGIRAGKIKTLLAFGEDPTKYGIPADLLAKLELLVASDIHAHAGTERAHFVLPLSNHFEKRGTFINVKGRLQKFTKTIEPPGDARPAWEFVAELLAQMDQKTSWSSIEGLFNRMAAEVPALAGLTWAGLGDTGVTIQF